MTTLTDFDNVFNNSIKIFESINNEEKDNLFESFRTQHSIYGFIDNGDFPPDDCAVKIAEQTNLELYQKYITHNKNKLILGYKNSSTNFVEYTNLDSRHIMMSVLLFTWLPEPVQNIVEIGGGFGNWLRLNIIQEFNKWYIIDLPHVSELQNWYLKKENIPNNKYELITALEYEKWNSTHDNYDLVIGSHSLSEFKFAIFEDYFNKVILKSKYLFFCYATIYSDSINEKLSLINTHFELLNTVLSENDMVANSLYKRL